ncbi:lysoplasmalogenase [Nocardiopsis sp. MG754419]|uniref:lysoplasmalogenase n=1 Tax=Nocardiopsis sp. MG754419 TaxID=2259865 RepID=UPI001BADDEA5|nr:lysoplasmalogenase [Nocardiopsis sp. MG754419]MBR8742976.1 lysoplasmalogenase [Nocardiopsis sp. MG754419]
MIPRRTLPRVLLALFTVLAVAHLAVRLLGIDEWSRPTQAFLMPALMLVVAGATGRPRSRLLCLAMVALVFSWLGDTAPAFASGDTGFLLMAGFFLVAQVVYVVAFWPHRTVSVLHRRRWLLTPYVGTVVLLVGVCAPHAGELLIPVLSYGLVLGTMAVLATGLGPWVAVGGALFLVSDALIALSAFAPGWNPPLNGFWVMSTYIAAQTLIVLGLTARPRVRAARARATR